MDFRYYKTIRNPDSDDLYIIGSMQEPVDWEFRITLGPEDVPGLIKVFFHPAALKLIIKNLHRYFTYLLHREKFVSRGSQDLEEKVNHAYEQVMYGRRPGSRQRGTAASTQ